LATSSRRRAPVMRLITSDDLPAWVLAWRHTVISWKLAGSVISTEVFVSVHLVTIYVSLVLSFGPLNLLLM
jgi:hypothetical protein